MKKEDLPKKIPVFPLSNFIIFPKTTVPLNIFEPRYIDMVTDSMKSDKFIGMIQPKNFNNNEDIPELHNIGCLGKITTLKKTEDGRFMIEINGLARFKIAREIASINKYRECEIDFKDFYHDLDEKKEELKFTDLELIFKDLESVEKRISRLVKVARSGDKVAKAHMAIAEKMKGLLEEGNLVSSHEWSETEWESILEAQLITSKPVLFVCNVDEDGLDEDNEFVTIVRSHAEKLGSGVVKVCAQAEAELSELEAEERVEFLQDLGIDEPGLDKLARATYALLGLQTYFTAGEKEIRAWTIKEGFKAPQAAGVIHTDFERGFIKAEVYSIQDLINVGSEKGLKEAGKLRIEGKEYIVKDGDVMHFRFNV